MGSSEQTKKPRGKRRSKSKGNPANLPDSRLVLESVFETMDEGVTVFDADLRLAAVNQRCREIMGLPESLCQLGTPFEALIRFNAERGDYGPGDIEQQVSE